MSDIRYVPKVVQYLWYLVISEEKEPLNIYQISDNICICHISDMFLRLCNICGIWPSQMRRSLSITELCPMTTLSHNRKATPLNHSDDENDDDDDYDDGDDEESL